MNKKTMTILITLVGIGLFAMPSTMALFAGQHSFTNIDATGNQIDCVKCHGDVNAELTGGMASATTGTESPHADFKCEYCHRMETGSASGDNALGVIPYLNGTKTVRVYLVPVSDMEAGNYPATINGSDVMMTSKDVPCAGTYSPSSVCVKLAGVSLKFVPGHNGGAKISPTTSDGVLTVGAMNSLKLQATYNPATAQPLDNISSTRNSGLEIARINVTMTSARPYYTLNFDYAGSRAVNPGTSYHAASLVSCMECHGGDEPIGHYTRVADGTANGGVVDCSNCHYGQGSASTGEAGAFMTTFWAGGFGLTSQPGDTGSSEAHLSFMKTNDTFTRYKDGASNGGCIACHTHTDVNITYNKPTTLGFNATINGDGTTSVGNFFVENMAVSTSSGN